MGDRQLQDAVAEAQVGNHCIRSGGDVATLVAQNQLAARWNCNPSGSTATSTSDEVGLYHDQLLFIQGARRYNQLVLAHVEGATFRPDDLGITLERPGLAPKQSITCEPAFLACFSCSR